MSYESKSDIDKLVTKLEERYETLRDELLGEALSKREQEMFEDKPLQVIINSHELRIAIDDFSVILKEIKRLCK